MTPSKPELRDLAYRILASAMLGEEYPGEHREEALAAAMEIVLSDDRKSRTAGERSVQIWAGACYVFQCATDPDIIRAMEQAGKVASGSLLGIMGEAAS